MSCRSISIDKNGGGYFVAFDLYKKPTDTISYLGVIRGVHAASGCMNFQHQCKILYTPDYTNITKLLHILLLIIIKFYVNVSFHIILLLCVVQNYFLAGVGCYLHPDN